MAGERSKIVEALNRGDTGKAEESLLLWMDEKPSDLQAVAAFAGRMFERGRYGLAFHLQSYVLSSWKNIPQELKAQLYSNNGLCLDILGEKQAAQWCFQQVLETGLHAELAYNGMGASYINQGQPEKIVEFCSKALEVKPDFEVAKFHLGMGHLEMGNWKEGWEGYRWREGSTKPRCYHDDHETQEWDGKKNRVVVAYAEQGVGDEILFGSCLPDLIAATKGVIVDCHPRLEKTWRRSFPGVEFFPTRKAKEITWHRSRQIDKRLAFGDMPRFFRNASTSFPGTPFLKADPARVAFYRAKLEALGPAPYVGIAWFGGEKKTRFDYRSVPLEKWKGLRAVGGTFVSLQYNKWGHRKEAREQGLPEWEGYYDFHGPIEDLDEMFALIEACDLVISVCQTAVHMAGALGKECWCLTPSRPAWRYGQQGTKMPWYNSVKLIRQVSGESWDEVLKGVADEYRQWGASRGDFAIPGGASVRECGGVQGVAAAQPESHASGD